MSKEKGREEIRGERERATEMAKAREREKVRERERDEPAPDAALRQYGVHPPVVVSPPPPLLLPSLPAATAAAAVPECLPSPVSAGRASRTAAIGCESGPFPPCLSFALLAVLCPVDCGESSDNGGKAIVRAESPSERVCVSPVVAAGEAGEAGAEVAAVAAAVVVVGGRLVVDFWLLGFCRRNMGE